MCFKNLDKCDNAKSGQVAKSWAKTSANVNRDARKLNGWHCLLLPINFFTEVKVKLPSICCPTLQWMDLKIKARSYNETAIKVLLTNVRIQKIKKR
jgi:hypothetical protein